MKKKVLLLIVIVACSAAAFASHIVGGEIYYKYIGNNKYNVKLILYRDCSNPFNLELDDSTEITAYKKFNTDAINFIVYRQSIDTLPFSFSSSCSQLPNVCVEKHVYTGTITLPSSSTGWSIFFSSCCRNSTVGNIETPDNTGATYLVNILPTSQLTTGFGNPEFVTIPPIAICVNKPISFNISVIKNPGDSIVYSLYTPFAQVDSNNNGQYVFNPIIWKLPYSLANLLGGTPLTINPVSGILSGTPNTLGQFLVGVQAQVYRNGILVAETRRDFQFNVADCFDNIGFTYNKLCGSKFVSFTNRTTGHNSFTWNFGDGSPQSTATNPTHTYTNFGTYTVTLHTDSIAGCPSTFSQVITLGNDKPTANFSLPTIPNCLGKGDTLRLTNLSRDTLGFPIVSWQWYVNGTLYSFDKNPIYYFDPNDAFIFNNIAIKLVVKTSTGCADSITKNISVKGIDPTYTLTHIYPLCQTGQPQSVRMVLTYDFFDFLTFKWTPSTGVSNTTSATPLITVSQPSTYYVTVTKVNNNFTCNVLDSIKIVYQKPDIYVPKDTSSVCGSSFIKITPGGDSTSYTIQWATDPNFTNIVSTKNTVVVNKPGGGTFITYYYNTSFGAGCSYKDSVHITFITGAPAIQLADNLSFCSRNITVPVTINPPSGIQWSTTKNFATIISTANPLVLTQAQNTVKYYVRSGSGNCISTDSVTVTAADPLTGSLVNDTFICGTKVLLKANLNGILVQSIKWSFSNTLLPVIATTDTVTITKPVGTTRKVYILVTATNSCTLLDSAIVTFNDQSPVITLVDDTLSCSDHIQLTAGISIPSTIQWSVNRNFTPVLSTTNPLNVIQSAKTVVYYIRATSNGCSVIDSARVTVPDTFPQIQLADRIDVCKDSVRLRPIITNATSIQWSLDNTFNVILSTQANLTLAQSLPVVTYYIKAFYGNCFLVDSVTVQFNNIVPDITLADSLFTCSNLINISASIINNDSARWYSDRNFTTSVATGTTLNTTQQQAVKTYYLKSYFLGCTSTDSITVINNAISYTAADVVVCEGKNVNIQLNVQSPLAYSIDWKYNDSLFTTNTGAIQINTDSAGTLSFIITNGSCRIADSLHVAFAGNPVVDAVADKDSIQGGEQVQLNTVPNTFQTYNWTPQNLVSNASISNPTSSPNQTTTYVVRVSDDNGCTGSDSVTVRVFNLTCDKQNAFIPNAFSPNGDHINDVFLARTTGLKSIKLLVYDRNGDKVFETTDPLVGWDGNYKGQPAPMDSYGYYFTGECLQGEKVVLRGNVTLLR